MDGAAAAERLAAYVKTVAPRANYDIASPRGDRMRLAKDAGMSTTTFSRMLSGDRVPDARSLVGLARALGIGLEEFFTESGIAEPVRPAEAVPSVGAALDAVAGRLGVPPEQHENFVDLVESVATLTNSLNADEALPHIKSLVALLNTSAKFRAIPGAIVIGDPDATPTDEPVEHDAE